MSVSAVGHPRRALLSGALGAGLLVALALLMLGPGVAKAQGPVEAEISISPDEAVIGDVLRVTASVTHPAGHTVGPLKLEDTWGPFEVRALRAPMTVANDDGSETTSVTFEAQVFALGVLTTPELSLTVQSPTGVQSIAVAAPVTVEIVSVLRDNELRDIRPQAQLPGPRTGLIAGLAIGGLAIVATTFLAYSQARRRRSPLPLGRAGQSRSPYEWAISELSAMSHPDLDEAEDLKRYYTQVSEILRRYLDAEFGLETIESTTAEVSRQVKRSALEWKLGHRVLSILLVADLVKFARYRPTPDEVETLVPDTIRVINDLHRESARSLPGRGVAEVDAR